MIRYSCKKYSKSFTKDTKSRQQLQSAWPKVSSAYQFETSALPSSINYIHIKIACSLTSVCSILDLASWFFPCISCQCTDIRLWRKTITVSSPILVSLYLCYLRRLIKPAVTGKALFHVWLSGFHFEDVWKASILTENVYPRPVRCNVFYMGVTVGISEL